MQRTHNGLCLGLLTLLLASRAAAQNAPAPPAILDKALQATGGEAKLAKVQALAIKGKGTFYEPGSPNLSFSGLWLYQGLDKHRGFLEVEVKGARSQELLVINGAKGWSKDGNLPTQDLDKDKLAEEKEGLYFNWLAATLVMLKGQDMKLTPVPEVQVAGRPAVGFTAARRGYRAVQLLFDKQSGLLVKTERKVQDLVNRKKDVLEEMLYSSYKEVGGIKLATRVTVKWDGQAHYDLDLTDIKVQAKLDEKLFAKP